MTYTMKHCSPKCAAEGKSKALSAFAKAHPERRIKNCTLSHEERVRLGKEAEEQRKALGDPRWHGGASA